MLTEFYIRRTDYYKLYDREQVFIDDEQMLLFSGVFISTNLLYYLQVGSDAVTDKNGLIHFAITGSQTAVDKNKRKISTVIQAERNFNI